MTVEIETEDLTGTDLAQIRKVDLVTDVQDHDQRKEKGMSLADMADGFCNLSHFKICHVASQMWEVV